MNRTTQFSIVAALIGVGACSNDPTDPSRVRCQGAHCPSQASRDAGNGSGGSSASGVANSFGNADAKVTSQTTDASVTPSTSMPNDCADQIVRFERVIPTVILVIDQSGSMNDAFANGKSRWDALRDFLLQKGGLIDSLQAQISFGLAMYTVMNDGNSHVVGECPLVTSLAPMIGNYDMIAKLYRASEPIGDTPTGDSIDKIVAGLDLSNPDHRVPTALILATDGEPDRCEQLDPQNGQQESIDAVTRAFKLGVRTYIMSVGSEVTKQHQQDVANAGVGHKPGEPDAPYWTAGDDTTLRSALGAIVNAQLSCQVELNGSVDRGDACRGHVTFNSEDLVCNDADGWELVDPKHIALKGKACDELKTRDAIDLRVAFPCDVAIVQ